MPKELIMHRTINRINTKTSALGMGCWAIGSEWTLNGEYVCYGKTDNTESIKAIQAAYETGIRVFDTAANYGAGLSEKLLAKALGSNIGNCFISTKFGFNVNEETKDVTPYGKDMRTSDVITNMEKDIDNSLRRLKRDHIDSLFFHIWDYDKELSLKVRDSLDNLVIKGKVKTFGWSIDNPQLIKLWGKSRNCGVTQVEINIIKDNPEVIGYCEEAGITIFNRTPLAMGFLTGKYSNSTNFNPSDVRNGKWAKEAYQTPALSAIEAVREIITSDGRTLTQGAIAWLWARSENNIPIPGIRTVKQAIENAKSMEFGPLSKEQFLEIEKVLNRKQQSA